ncbi:hypothetical protein ACFC5Z_26680, partial [Streptomyces sp. NPDC056004]|uniref:hypothetical protein n=1 Tax=Streptomyces sp. NPDC056004 TaxID=3345677 RepID=UPI0035DE7952
MTGESATSGSAASEIEALRASADAPGAKVLQIADRLSSLSTALASNKQLADAVDAQQAAVDVLRAHPSTAAGELAGYQFSLALGLHHLAIRLWAVQSDADALTAARDALSAYQQAVATPGTANFLQIGRLLDELSGELAAHHQSADAVDAQQAAVDVLRAHPSTAAGELAGYQFS